MSSTDDDDDNKGRCAIDGTLDAARAGEWIAVAREWAARTDEPLVVDCAALERVDGAGLQLLIAIHVARAAVGRSMILRRLPDPVRITLRQAGADRVLRLEEAT